MYGETDQQSEIEKDVLRELSTTTVELRSNRRPVIFDRLLSVGLRQVKLGVTVDEIAAVKRALVRQIAAIFQRIYDPVIDNLRSDVARLEAENKKLREERGLIMTEKQLAKVRRYRSYGLTIKELARVFEVTEADIRKITRNTYRMVQVTPTKKASQGGQSSGASASGQS